MLNKKLMMLAILLVGLLAVGCASATDDLTGDVISMEDATDESVGIENQNDELIVSNEDNVLKSTQNSFSDLNRTINGNTDTEIYLENDYTYNPDTDSDFLHGIVIDRGVSIYGNGITIDGANTARIFNVTNSSTVFHDIIFVNAYAFESKYDDLATTIAHYVEKDGAAICGESTAINCTFINNTAYRDGGALYHGNAINCTFINNTAVDGAAMNMGSAVNCTFIKNHAYRNGGGIKNGNAVNCTFILNHAGNSGGGMSSGTADGHTTFILNYAESAITAGNYYYTELKGEQTIIETAAIIASDFISTPNSGEKLIFYILADNGQIMEGLDINITVKNATGAISTYNFISGEDWVVDLAPGRYEATLSGIYPIIQPVNITIKITDGTTFSDLDHAINGNGASEVVLDRDYKYNATVDPEFIDGVVIDREVTVDGNGHVLNGANQARIFNVTGDNVVLKRIILADANSAVSGCDVYWTGSEGLISNCSFKTSPTIRVKYRDFVLTLTLEITIADADLIHGDVEKQNLLYWNGTNYLGDIPDSGTFKLSNQRIVLEFISQSTGNLSDNFTDLTDINGQIRYDYTVLENGRHNYTAYYLDKDSSLTKTTGSLGVYRISGNTFQDINDVVSRTKDGDGIILEGHTYTGSKGYMINVGHSITIIGQEGTVLFGSNNARMFNVTADEVTIRNIQFDEASYYGIYMYGANGMVYNCSFINSTGSITWNGEDGAVYNCSFINNNRYNEGLVNLPYYGGAITWTGSNGSIFGCNFRDYYVIANPGYFTAIYSTKKCDISNCSFKANPTLSEIHSNVDLTLNFTIESHMDYKQAILNGNPKNCYYWNGDYYVFSENRPDFGIFNFTDRNFSIEIYDSNGNLIENNTHTINNNNQFIYDYRHLPNGRYKYDAYYTRNDNDFYTESSFGFYKITGNTFQDIQDTVRNASYVDGILLEGHTYYGNGTPIEVDKCLVIVGQEGTVLDAQGLSGILNVTTEFSTRYLYCTNITFINGNASDGGAIFMQEPGCNIFNCSFINNTASGDGGAIHNRYGGERTVINCTFINNTATNGGVFYGRGGCRFYNCSFINNTASARGGAIHVAGFSANIIDCEFIKNSASNSGAIYSEFTMLSVFNDTIFVDNTANDRNVVHLEGIGDIYNIIFKINPTLSIINDDLTLVSSLEANLDYTNTAYIDYSFNRNNISYWNGSYVNADNPDWGIVKLTNQNITFEIYDSDSNLVSNVTRVTDSNGQAEYKHTDIPDGRYTYVAYYSDRYSKVVQKGEFEFHRNETYMNVNVSNIVHGENATVDVELASDATGSVDISFIGNSNQTYTNIPIDNGKASLVVPGLMGGTYDVAVRYSGNDIYNVAFANATLKVKRIDYDIKVSAENIRYGEVLVVNVTLPSDASRRAVVTIGNVTKLVSLTNGTGTAKFKGISAGTHTITVTYNGDANYIKGKTATTTVKVYRGDVDIEVSAKNIRYGEDLLVNVKLSSDVSRRAVVTVGNETKLVVLTNGTGTAKFKGLAVGTHTITVSYNGDANYMRGKSVNTTVKVGKGPADIKVSVNNNHPVIHHEALTVEVTLPNASRRVNITIGNESKLVSLTNGTGTVKFNGLDAGTYTIVASYNGDDTYVKSSVNTTLKVARAFPEFALEYNEIVYSDTTTIYITLPSDASRRVVFNLDNVTIRNVALEDGCAAVELSGLSAGIHNVECSYPGDAFYTPAENSIQFEVIA